MSQQTQTQSQNGVLQAAASAPANVAAPSASQQPAARPYRRFVIPSMHRRFTNAALLSLALCGVQAFWMGRLSSIWQVFGANSIRALLLFIPVLAIYILRIANLQVGKRTTMSGLHTIYQCVFSFAAARTFLWYSFSAIFFCEVYIWSCSSSAKLSIVVPGRLSERQLLNERPIFLRTMFLCLAIARSITHIYHDRDRSSIPVVKQPTTFDALRTKSQRAFWVPLLALRQDMFRIASDSFFLVFTTTFTAPVVYWLFVRQLVWSWTFAFAKHVFDLARSSVRPPTFPTLVVDLLGRFLVEGFLLMLSWELASTAFDAYLTLEPMKQGRPLSDDSRDPNGSLLNGLKTTRPLPRTFASWELVLIADYMTERRKTIYSEISRQGGSTWAQILTVCLGELHAVVQRIQTFQTPIAQQQQQQQEKEAETQQIHTLPKVAPLLKQDNIFRTAPRPSSFSSSKFTAQAPSSTHAEKLLSSSATKLLTYTTDATLSPATQQRLTQHTLAESLRALAQSTLAYPPLARFVAPLRQTRARRAAVVVCDAPRSRAACIVDACTALVRLVVHSKRDDVIGGAYRDIATVVRTFTSTHNVVEAFVARGGSGIAAHWTDVGVKGASKASSAGARAEQTEAPDGGEVGIVLEVLRDGLREMINEFGEYSDDLGLSIAEMRAAKVVAAKSRRRDEDVIVVQ